LTKTKIAAGTKDACFSVLRKRPVFGARLHKINDINVPPPNAVSLPRPLTTILPNLGTVGFLQSEGISNYNGLQASFQRRFSRGLAFDANYTWGHALSDITGFSQEGQEGWSNQDPNHIRQYEYGNAAPPTLLGNNSFGQVTTTDPNYVPRSCSSPCACSSERSAPRWRIVDGVGGCPTPSSADRGVRREPV
jgi:hypothetical protein